MEQGRITPAVKRNIEKRELKKQKTEADKQFEADCQYTLSILIDATHKAAKAIKTVDDLEEYGSIFQMLPWWEYSLELLYFGMGTPVQILLTRHVYTSTSEKINSASATS